MEVIFCAELWVTNNHNVLRELSCPLVTCAVPATKVTESSQQEEPNLTQFLSFVTRKYQSATAITSLRSSSLLCCQCLLLALAFQS